MGTFIKPTTLAKVMPGSGGTGTNLTFAKYRNAGNTAWVDCGFIKCRNAANTAWVWEYSTPDVTAGVSGSGAGSGASPGGTSTRSLSATPGGVNSGTLSYSWGRQSGDTGTYLDVSTAQNPTVKQDFTSVANGSTSTGSSSVWRCTVTDTVTGAQVYSDVTVGAFSWQNQIPAFGPIIVTFHNFSNTVHDSNSPGGVVFTNVPVAMDMTPYISGGNGVYTLSWVFNPSGSSPGLTPSIDNPSIINPIATCSIPCAPNDSQTGVIHWDLTVGDTFGSTPVTQTIQSFHTHTRP